MFWRAFESSHHQVIREAVVIAEEMTSDFYKLSRKQWQQARYDIITLTGLRPAEISPHALALVAKYNCWQVGRWLKSAHYDFYRICLQDHNILRLLEEKSTFRLLPLLVYVVTHELVHVVRFGHFQQLFEAPQTERALEEKRVHRLTQQILGPLKLPQLDEIMRYYQQHPEIING